jgi:hypothetical protein
MFAAFYVVLTFAAKRTLISATAPLNTKTPLGEITKRGFDLQSFSALPHYHR